MSRECARLLGLARGEHDPADDLALEAVSGCVSSMCVSRHKESIVVENSCE